MAMTCPDCGIEMNHQAEKPVEPRSPEEVRQVDPDIGVLIEEIHTCPECGKAEARLAGSN
jgi:predicted RNA-binding Zn-ribbon protein involved in translation (DUF1610 family)